MTELKRCPFCGGEVAIAETETGERRWMFILGAHGENKCSCRIFMESEDYWFDCSKKDKEKIKADLIKAWNKRYKEN